MESRNTVVYPWRKHHDSWKACPSERSFNLLVWNVIETLAFSPRYRLHGFVSHGVTVTLINLPTFEPETDGKSNDVWRRCILMEHAIFNMNMDYVNGSERLRRLFNEEIILVLCWLILDKDLVPLWHLYHVGYDYSFRLTTINVRFWIDAETGCDVHDGGEQEEQLNLHFAVEWNNCDCLACSLYIYICIDIYNIYIPLAVILLVHVFLWFTGMVWS